MSKYENMSTQEICENCIHFDVCEWAMIKKNCSNFKDKSLFVELRVKLGQTVYIPWAYGGNTGIASVKVVGIKICNINGNRYMLYPDIDSDDEVYKTLYCGWKFETDIGKTVFLTEEQAKVKLKEMGDSK